MRCPGCNAVAVTSVGSCPRCGYSFVSTDPGGYDAADAVSTDPGEMVEELGGDPERAVGTVIGTFDRQRAVATKLGIVAPRRRKSRDEERDAAASAGAGFLHLPDSTVSRDFDEAVMELRVFLARMGLVGRLTAYAQSLVLVGALLPWLRIPGVGQASGVEDLGWLPGGLTLLGTILHIVRYRRNAILRPLCALGALLLSAGSLLALFWAFRVNSLLDDAVRPTLLWGFWFTMVAALLALVGTLLSMKDIGARR
jgi:hypothetical protein